MDNPSSNPQTGGLKLMTVFIVVLALHVAVIGGISAYHLLKGSGSSKDDAVATKTEAAPEGTEVKPIDPALTENKPAIDANAPAAPVITPEDALAAEPQHMAVPPVAANSAPPVTNEIAPVPVVVDTKVPAPAVTASSSYAVKPGDTLNKIAHRNGMKVADLKKMNNLTSDNLKIGQKLKVTGSSSTAVAAAVEKAPAAVTKAAPAVKATVAAPTAGGATYTVAKGDTLTKIAKHFKTTPSALMAANKLSDPTKLRVGAKLVIPGSATVRSQVTETKEPAKVTQPREQQGADLVMAR